MNYLLLTSDVPEVFTYHPKYNVFFTKLFLQEFLIDWKNIYYKYITGVIKS